MLDYILFRGKLHLICVTSDISAGTALSARWLVELLSCARAPFVLGIGVIQSDLPQTMDVWTAFVFLNFDILIVFQDVTTLLKNIYNRV